MPLFWCTCRPARNRNDSVQDARRGAVAINEATADAEAKGAKTPIMRNATKENCNAWARRKMTKMKHTYITQYSRPLMTYHLIFKYSVYNLHLDHSKFGRQHLAQPQFSGRDHVVPNRVNDQPKGFVHGRERLWQIHSSGMVQHHHNWYVHQYINIIDTRHMSSPIIVYHAGSKSKPKLTTFSFSCSLLCIAHLLLFHYCTVLTVPT